MTTRRLAAILAADVVGLKDEACPRDGVASPPWG
jgi:hypothetical protein